jgi:multicomponent Na+:H+ antiporter subunit C
MILLFAIASGVLFATGIYMLLRRSLVKILIGLLLLSYAVNLLLFSSANLIPAKPPIIPPGENTPPPGFADPVPQALILTAIVISFGTIAFAMVLIRQSHIVSGTDDMNKMRCSDLPCETDEVVDKHSIEVDKKGDIPA